MCREPKRLRPRIFAIAGRIARGGRRMRLRLTQHWPWAAPITAAFTVGKTPPRLTSTNHPCDQEETPTASGTRPPHATAGPPVCPSPTDNTKRPAGQADGPP